MFLVLFLFLNKSDFLFLKLPVCFLKEGIGWIEEWGRVWGRGNCDKNIVHEEFIFSKKLKWK